MRDIKKILFSWMSEHREIFFSKNVESNVLAYRKRFEPSTYEVIDADKLSDFATHVCY